MYNSLFFEKIGGILQIHPVYYEPDYPAENKYGRYLQIKPRNNSGYFHLNVALQRSFTIGEWVQKFLYADFLFEMRIVEST